MPKPTNTKPAASNKKQASKADPKKPQSKAAAEKKAPRRNLNQVVGFVYGGDIIKASHVYLFSADNLEVVDYVRANLVQNFGSRVSGRYVKCEDAEEILNAVYAAAEEKEYNVDPECKNILKSNINDAAELIKTASGSNAAHTIKLNEESKAKKTTAKSTKAGAKGGKAGAAKGGNKKTNKKDEEDADENEEVAEEGDEEANEEEGAEGEEEEAQDEEGEEGEEVEEEENAEGDEEEEDTKAAKKPAAQKQANKGGAAPKGGRGRPKV